MINNIILLSVLVLVFIELNQFSRKLYRFEERASLYRKDTPYLFLMRFFENKIGEELKVIHFDNKFMIYKKENDKVTSVFMLKNEELTYSIYYNYENVNAKCINSGQGLIYECVYTYLNFINKLENGGK